MPHSPSRQRIFRSLLLATLGLSAFFLPSGLSARIFFNRLDHTNGLPQINVVSIYQDETDVMWFGTTGGLCRYNGSSARVFRSSPEYPDLTGNNILSVTGNRNGAVYIRTEFDLIRYDIASERFRLIFGGVTGMFHGGGRLWFNADGKIYTWSEETEEVSFMFDAAEITGNRTVLWVSDGGDVWIGGGNGMAVVRNGTTRTVLKGEYIYSLHIDSEGLVWAGTNKNGLYVLDAEGNVRRHFAHASDRNSLPDNFVRTVTEDERGTIWVGTAFGIGCFDKTTDRWTNHIPDDTRPGSLSDYSVFAIHRDMQNTVWVGTYYGGVNYFNPRRDIFTYYTPSSTITDRLSFPFVGNMATDSSGNLWICTEGGGLNRLDMRTRTFKRFYYENFDPGHTSAYHLKSICRDPRTGKLYIGVYDVGLWVFDPETETGVLHRNPDLAVRKTQLWRGGIVALAGRELFRIDTTDDSLAPFSDDGELCAMVKKDYAYSFFIDSRDRLWLPTVAGLKRIDLRTKELREYRNNGDDPRSFVRSEVLSFVETSDGELFFCTLGSGLLRYEPATDDFDNYTERDKTQVSDFSYHASEMSDGRLLILHNNTFSIFDPRRGATVYNSPGNFPISGYFEGNSSLVTPSGEIFIGGVNGLASVDEARLSASSPIDYSFHFDNLTVLGVAVSPGDRTGILSQTLSRTDAIRLRHNQNSFSVEFSTFDYSRYGAMSDYEYRLEGLNTEWEEAGSNIISYTRLNPGKYRLVLREANPDKSDARKTIRSLDITISPPFYLTAFARVLYVLLSAALIAGVMFFFTWRYRMRTAVGMERKEKENAERLNRMKLGFFTGVSHEFRTPLTLIMAQTEHILSSGELDPETKRGVAKVHDNATHMRDLISELLDFQKAEQGFYRLKVEPVDMIPYVERIWSSFSEYAAKHNIEYRYDFPRESAAEAYIDRVAIQKAIFNLLSNAFKYTHDGGAVTVRLSADDDIRILVEDNGIGISPEALSNIFERFYQVEYRTSGFSLGTGIGLALAKEMIESHKGTITVSSTLNEGSVFEIRLPRGSSNFDDAESSQLSAARQFATTPSPTDGPDTPPSASSAAQGEDVSLLIVEDNEQLLTLLAEIFSDEYTIHTAVNGRQGLEMAEDILPDVILTDIMMPEMSGKEMCLRLKSNMKLSYIPIVMLTSLDSVDETVEGYMFGADDYVTKPFNVEILKARLGGIVRNRRRVLRTATENSPATGMEIRSEQDRLFMEKAAAIIRANFDNPEFDMNILASEMGMGRTNFYTRMKEVSGMTPNEFTLAAKLRESTELLRDHQHLNISEIADRLGFYSTKYFTKCFKTFYGIPPTQWRKENE